MQGKKRGAAVLAAGAAVQLFTGIPAAWGVFQQPVMAEYGLARWQAMLIFAVLVAAYGAGCIPGGLWQDTCGPRPPALCGALLLGGGFLAAAAFPAGGVGWFLLGFALPAGAGSALLCPAVLACAQKWYRGKKGIATGVAGVTMGLSGLFYTLFVGGAAGRWGLRPCLAALGVLILAVCGPAALVLRDPPAAAGPPQPGAAPDYPPGAMLKTRQYRLCAAAVALAGPAVLLFSPEIIALAQERGMPEGAARWLVAAGAAAGALGRLLCPAVSDAAGRKRTAAAMYAGLALGSAAFAAAGGWWVAAAWVWLTFCYAGAAALQPALCTDLFGLAHAGVNYGFFAAGMGAGSLLSFAGAQLLPPAARHWAGGLCAAAGFLCLLALRPPPPRVKEM